MEREILKYELEYALEDGSVGLIPIEVDTITHEMRSLMWDILKEQYRVQSYVAEIKDIQQKAAISIAKVGQVDEVISEENDISIQKACASLREAEKKNNKDDINEAEKKLQIAKDNYVKNIPKEKDKYLEKLTKEIQGYTDQIKKISTTIEAYNDGAFFKKRFDVIKKILVRNRVNDERLLSFEFWESCTHETAIIELLNLFYYKDIKKNSPLETQEQSATH